MITINTFRNKIIINSNSQNCKLHGVPYLTLSCIILCYNRAVRKQVKIVICQLDNLVYARTLRSWSRIHRNRLMHCYIPSSLRERWIWKKVIFTKFKRLLWWWTFMHFDAVLMFYMCFCPTFLLGLVWLGPQQLTLCKNEMIIILKKPFLFFKTPASATEMDQV